MESSGLVDSVKLETVRKERLGEFIEKVRPVVKDVWELCCLTKDEQEMLNTQLDSFPPESEECLEAWEKELEVKKKFYREREGTFKNLDTLNAEWSEFLALEQIEKDPERYKSRKMPSTQIMKEQQRKRKLESLIRKSERSLEKLSDDFEAKGNPLFIFGILLKDYVKAKRELYDEMKEIERALKNQEKKEKERMGWGINVPKGPVVRKTPVKRALVDTMSSTKSPAAAFNINGAEASGATCSNVCELSVDFNTFEKHLKDSKDWVNSTFKDDFVTRRRDKKADQPLQKVDFGHGLRRKSRSYVNLNVVCQRGGMVTPEAAAKQFMSKSSIKKRRPF